MTVFLGAAKTYRYRQLPSESAPLYKCYICLNKCEVKYTLGGKLVGCVALIFVFHRFSHIIIIIKTKCCLQFAAFAVWFLQNTCNATFLLTSAAVCVKHANIEGQHGKHHTT